jgi:hypothetical protein
MSVPLAAEAHRRRSSGHLCQYNIAGRGARAHEVEHLTGRACEILRGTLTGISAEALLAVTTAVESMVTQRASVEAVRTCLV